MWYYKLFIIRKNGCNTKICNIYIYIYIYIYKYRKCKRYKQQNKILEEAYKMKLEPTDESDI
ncbi:MAG: hypothetical protein N7Q72_06265, partial [Spiroplasma sp. Tabriz.8]|nr:hypothetical protein [Spiroplasma sp. Tabriz.8]